ncbi:neuronal acetylcholine receptor subunit beta-3-like [Branchiostoma lanceolatum]|uniref:neuronal acetylcholine receptor subunit beta-3-like n=1 Tax=Branchiostoma lanceolatum TaxID=7740 RepID=UPI003453C08E
MKRFYNVGERVAYTCNRGYSIKSGHPGEVRCTEGGIWEDDKPSCSENMEQKLAEELLDVYSPSQAPVAEAKVDTATATGTDDTGTETDTDDTGTGTGTNDTGTGTGADGTGTDTGTATDDTGTGTGTDDTGTDTDNTGTGTKAESHPRFIIGFNGYVEQIVDLDEKKEFLIASVVIDFTWQDSRLKWDLKYYENIESLTVPASSIWTPTFTLKRNANPLYEGLPKDVPLRVSLNGTVTWRVETLTTTICEADPFFFPADTMTCDICFSAFSAIGEFIECGEGSTCDVWSTAEPEGEWNRKDKISARDNKEACFTLQLDRMPLFHLATTVGPCAILVVLMIITFIMPIDRGDRISFGVTIQLSVVMCLVFVTEVLPVKGALPFFAALIVVCMGLMGIFLFFTIGIIKIHDKEGSLSPMAKNFFLRYMAKFLLLGDLTEKEAVSEDGEAGLTGRKLAWPARANTVAPADDLAKVNVGTSAEVSGKTRQPSVPPTPLEVAVSSGISNLTSSVEELAKAMKNEQEVSDYTLLAKVLDRLCLVLYVISIAVSVPMIIYLSK